MTVDGIYLFQVALMLFNFDHGSFAVEKKPRCPSSAPNFSDQ